MPFRFLALLLLFGISAALHAESDSSSRYQIYAGYSFLSNALNGLPGAHRALNGWDTALAFPPWHALRFKLDISGYRGTNAGAPQHPLFLLAGGQYAWKVRRESLFGEALVGTSAANRDWPGNGIHGQTASFATLIGGGLDTPLTRRFAFRVEGGYHYTYLVYSGSLNDPYSVPGLPTNFGRLSSGLVWNF